MTIQVDVEELVRQITSKWSSNKMLEPRIAKVVVNIGVGASGERLERATKLLEQLVDQKPSVRKAKRTIKEFDIKKGETIAATVTLRGSKAAEFLEKALTAVGRRIKYSSFDDYGNVSFGIREHIVLPGAKYDPDIGIFGMDVTVKLERPGYRVMRRRRCKSTIPRRHRVSRVEAAVYFMTKLGVKVVGFG